MYDWSVEAYSQPPYNYTQIMGNKPDFDGKMVCEQNWNAAFSTCESIQSSHSRTTSPEMTWS